MAELDLTALVAALQQHPLAGDGDMFLKLPVETARGLLEELRQRREASEKDLRFTRVLISNNGKRQRRLERLRRDLKNIARATTVSSAQSMARGALATDVALRRRDSAEEVKEREARQAAAGAA